MNRPARKPARRTAWSMLLCGLGVAALMVGVGVYVVGKGQSAGPDRPATWPAGAEIAVARPLGRQQDDAGNRSTACTVTPPDGRPRTIYPRWQQRMRPDFTGPATVTCRQPVKVLTGSSVTVAAVTRGPLIAVPLFAAGVGVFLFFPRFTVFVASLSHPFGRVVDRITGRDRNI